MREQHRRKPFQPSGLVLGAWVLVLFVLFVGWACPGLVSASGPLETLDKIGRIIDQAKDVVQTITDGEAGEKELIEDLAARFQSNEDLDAFCQDVCREAAADTAIAEYHLLFSGLLKDVQPIDLVKLVKEKLSRDGFSFLQESSSGGRRIIWFDNHPAGQTREKWYMLSIHEGWTRKLTDFFTGRETNRSFCLSKFQKI